jgi:predicted TIM-barrel fold metal-dependent hydrolase
MSLTPSEYFKRQIYATTWFERTDIASMIATVGEDNIMFETDFPHPTCLYPSPVESVAGKMDTLRPETRARVMGDNARKVYRL